MKIINLVPPAVAMDRSKTKIKKSILILTLASVGYTFGMNRYLLSIENEIEKLQTIITDSKALSEKVSSTEEGINKLRDMRNVIAEDSFPYHRFFYSIAMTVPEDMRVLSIESKTETQLQEDLKSELAGKDNSMETAHEDTTDTSLENASETPSDSSANSVQIQEAAPMPENLNGQSQLLTKNEPDIEKNQILFEHSTLYLKGYSLYPDSIATFAQKIRNESFIKSVKVTKVDNYNLGFSNFKLFELEIKTK